MGVRASLPNQSMGYWRGAPLAGGSGSGMGQADAGAGVLNQGFGAPTAGNWHPTVLYMVGLLIAEMIVFGVLGRVLK
jgi:hypothetical protein